MKRLLITALTAVFLLAFRQNSYASGLSEGETAYAVVDSSGNTVTASDEAPAVIYSGDTGISRPGPSLGRWVQDDKGWWYENADGSYTVSGWKYIDGSWYYFDSEGYMVTGWQTIDGAYYYFYQAGNSEGAAEGAMAKDTEINGVTIDSEGKADRTAESAQAAALLDQVGWDIKAAYNWCATMTYHRMTTDKSLGSRYFADYGFRNHSGNCYVMAATFYELARTAGADAYLMAGSVPLRKGGMGPHAWVEIHENGSVYVCDPDFQVETGKNGYRIYYGQSGTWRYSSYSVMQ